MNVSDALKAWRGVTAANGRGDLTQLEAAARLGVPLKTYLDWEQGRHAPRGLALEALRQKIKFQPGGARKSNRERRRPTGQSPSPAATGARSKRVTNAKKQTSKKKRVRA